MPAPAPHVGGQHVAHHPAADPVPALAGGNSQDLQVPVVVRVLLRPAVRFLGHREEAQQRGQRRRAQHRQAAVGDVTGQPHGDAVEQRDGDRLPVLFDHQGVAPPEVGAHHRRVQVDEEVEVGGARLHERAHHPVQRVLLETVRGDERHRVDVVVARGAASQGHGGLSSLAVVMGMGTGPFHPSAAGCPDQLFVSRMSLLIMLFERSRATGRRHAARGSRHPRSRAAGSRRAPRASAPEELPCTHRV